MAEWNITSPTTEYYDHTTPGIEAVVREVMAAPEVAIDTETTGLVIWKDVPLYWSLAWGQRRMTLNVSALHLFAQAFADPTKRWILANAKYDAHILANVGVVLAGSLVDTCVMHALLYEERPHGLKEMNHHLFGWKWQDFQDTFGKITKAFTPTDLIRTAEANNFPLLCEYAANDAWGTWQVYLELKQQLMRAQTHSLFRGPPLCIETLWDLFDKIEVPYTKVLYRTERKGVLVNVEYLESIAPTAIAEIEELERAICKEAGTVINPASPKQLREYFFDKMGMKPLKMSSGGKTGIRNGSVDEKFLTAHEYDSPMAAMILRHRSLKKLHGTYIKGLGDRLDPFGRIHSRFNQDVARTGRLSCVAGWTKLKTPRGDVPICDVVAGDYVWTHKGRWREVCRSFTKGIGHMYDLHLSNGKVLTCTTDHKLLLQDGRWLPVGDIVDEHLKEMGRQPEECELSAQAVPVEGTTNCRASGTQAEHDVPQRVTCAEGEDAGRGASDVGEAAVLRLEDGLQESHEGKEGRQAPGMGRRVRGWPRVSNVSTRRKASVRSSSSDGEGTRAGGAALPDGRAPHRQRPEEQQAGQPRVGDGGRASAYPLFAGAGLDPVEISEVHYRGRLEVHDVTIEEDESYEACGVLSHNSSDPNMQNIPKPENDKWKLRGAFVAPPGHRLSVVDYEQLEMRLLAAASGEAGMLDVIAKGWDIHMGNASMIFDIPYEEIKAAKKTPEDQLTARHHECLAARAAAKNIGFGIIYGMGPKKMAGDLGITLGEAKAKIQKFKETYPAVDAFTIEAVEETRQTGYAFTILGRRRNVPEIASHRNFERMKGERIAVNTQIQGSAADVVKMAQILLDKSGIRERFGAEPNLQVHDELMHEIPNETAVEAEAEIKDWMQHPFPEDLLVHLGVDGTLGGSWMEAK